MGEHLEIFTWLLENGALLTSESFNRLIQEVKHRGDGMVYRRQQIKAGENLRFPVLPWFQIPALTVAQLDGKSIQKTSINIEVNMYT